MKIPDNETIVIRLNELASQHLDLNRVPVLYAKHQDHLERVKRGECECPMGEGPIPATALASSDGCFIVLVSTPEPDQLWISFYEPPEEIREELRRALSAFAQEQQVGSIQPNEPIH